MRSESEVRAKFEACVYALNLTRDGAGYSASDTDFAWRIWKAALASQGEQVAGDALAALKVAIGEATGTRVSLHLTRAKQIYAALAARQPVGGGDSTCPLCAAPVTVVINRRYGEHVEVFSYAPPAQPQAPAAAVPEAKVYDPADTTLNRERKIGWNECRHAMLAAAPAPGVVS